jgi:predicted RNase H-like HicB family nuclease
MPARPSVAGQVAGRDAPASLGARCCIGGGARARALADQHRQDGDDCHPGEERCDRGGSADRDWARWCGAGRGHRRLAVAVARRDRGQAALLEIRHTFAFHDGATIPPGLVRKVLCRDVGLGEPEALKATVKVAMTVRVLYHHELEGWWAESPDIEGWSVVGQSYEEVRRLAEDGVPFALASAAEGRGEAFDEEQFASVSVEHYVPAPA